MIIRINYRYWIPVVAAAWFLANKRAWETTAVDWTAVAYEEGAGPWRPAAQWPPLGPATAAVERGWRLGSWPASTAPPQRCLAWGGWTCPHCKTAAAALVDWPETTTGSGGSCLRLLPSECDPQISKTEEWPVKKRPIITVVLLARNRHSFVAFVKYLLSNFTTLKHGLK